MFGRALLFMAVVLSCSIASAATLGGQALRDWMLERTDEEIEALIRAYDGGTYSTPIQGVIQAGEYFGGVTLHHSAFVPEPLGWVANNTSGLASIDAWRAHNNNVWAMPSQIPWGAVGPYGRTAFGYCVLGISITVAGHGILGVGTRVTWFHTRPSEGAGSVGHFGVEAEGMHRNMRSNIAPSRFGVDDYYPSTPEYYCQDPITLSEWMDGVYPGGTPHPEVVDDVRGGLAAWLHYRDQPQFVHTPPSGIVYEPAMTEAEAAQGPDPEDEYTPPWSGGGGGPGGGGVDWGTAPEDPDTSCSIIDIPCNLRYLFVPSGEYQASVTAFRNTVNSRAPFAWVAWFTHQGAVHCDLGRNEHVGRADDPARCWNGVIHLDFGELPGTGVRMSTLWKPFDSPGFVWWNETGKSILFAIFMALWLYGVVRSVLS